jgi:hypothetical protein
MLDDGGVVPRRLVKKLNGWRAVFLFLHRMLGQWLLGERDNLNREFELRSFAKTRDDRKEVRHTGFEPVTPTLSR